MTKEILNDRGVIPGDATSMSVLLARTRVVFCDGLRRPLIHLLGFWVNLEQAHVFTPSSLLCTLLVGQFGKGRGCGLFRGGACQVKDCGFLMCSQVL